MARMMSMVLFNVYDIFKVKLNMILMLNLIVVVVTVNRSVSYTK